VTGARRGGVAKSEVVCNRPGDGFWGILGTGIGAFAMEILDQLAVALGFATLAGINLYLVTFVTGLAIRMQWVVLDERFADLQTLASDPVLVVAGALMVTEFLADKIPWVDSVWDSFHTLIRPVGGGLLAVSAIGTTRPEYDVIIALVAGGAALLSHGFKTGTRMAVNASPEPISNTLVSVAEDVTVLGGLALMKAEPKLVGGLAVLFLLVAAFALPKLFRRIRGFYWLLFHNVLGDRKAADAPHGLGPEAHAALFAAAPGADVLWTTPVLCGRTRGLPGLRSWLRGRLVGVRGTGVGSRSRLYFVGNQWRRVVCVEIPGDGPLEIRHERGLLGQKLAVYDTSGKFLAMFRIPVRQGQVRDRVVDLFRSPGNALGAEKPA